MIKSMTGYGKALCEFSGRKITIEIKSLNSKAFDLNLKLPGVLREKEMELRNRLSQRLERGKIDIFTTSESNGESLKFGINKAIAKRYQEELKSLQVELGEEDMPGLLPIILKMPDVIQSGREELSEEDADKILVAVNQAVELLDEFRIKEGEILEADFRQRIDLILGFLIAIEPLEKERTLFIREKLRREFRNMSESENQSGIIDENRFEQELIFYLERLDITEEKVRLKKHCDFFLDTMTDENGQGKKLGFIVQEIGREINTIGSKANDAGIQKFVVQMKDELEKIKEQLLNIL
jgi:uncharacterized protein (TIGR00255 family)